MPTLASVGKAHPAGGAFAEIELGGIIHYIGTSFT
jgi:hypothetical protein